MMSNEWKLDDEDLFTLYKRQALIESGSIMALLLKQPKQTFHKNVSVDNLCFVSQKN